MENFYDMEAVCSHTISANVQQLSYKFLETTTSPAAHPIVYLASVYQLLPRDYWNNVRFHYYARVSIIFCTFIAENYSRRFLRSQLLCNLVTTSTYYLPFNYQVLF